MADEDPKPPAPATIRVEDATIRGIYDLGRPGKPKLIQVVSVIPATHSVFLLVTFVDDPTKTEHDFTVPKGMRLQLPPESAENPAGGRRRRSRRRKTRRRN